MADIELVIIPEEIYKASQIIDVKREDVIQIPLEAIAHGIPLPKGHGELVDVDKLRPYEFERNYIHIDELDNAPTIIEADKAESEDKE